jgi:hypothetical protein
MTKDVHNGLRQMSISHTANEIIARQIVDRLCRKPPYGQCWRDYAIREISYALAVATVRRRREDAKSDQHRSTGAAHAAAPC